MKKALKLLYKKNKKIKQLRFLLSQQRKEFAKSVKEHTQKIRKLEEKMAKNIADTQKEKDFWFNSIESMRILQREIKVKLASIEQIDKEMFQKLGIKTHEKNEIRHNLKSIDNQIEKGIKHLQ
jgi:arginine deiminase